MENALLQYGVLGVVVLGMAYYIVRIEIRHAKERKEWQDKDDRHFNTLISAKDESNRVIRENTNILAGLKALLENKNK